MALTLRLVNLWQLSGTPVADLLFGDGRAYDAWARSILAGPWMGREVFYQAPLYPYFLAVVYAVAGPSLLAVRLLQTALGVAACIWLGFAGRRFFSPAVGQLAALGLAIWPSAIFADGVIQKTALDSALICAFLATLAVAIDKTSFRWWMTGGLVLGILALTRENALALVPTTLLVIAAGWHAGPPGARRAPAVAALLLGVTLVLSPVTLRNHSFSGEWHLTTAQFGPNFFIGNHAGATGIYAPLRYGRGDALYERQDATELAEAALGRPLTPGEVSSYWTDRALAFIGEQPVEWAALLARKSALLVNSEEVADTEDQYTHAELSIALAILGPLFNFGFLTPLAAAGVVLAWPRRRTLAPLLLIGGVYGASVVATYVMARYRHPLLPLLLLFAASALIDARRLWRAGARRPLAFAALAATLVAVPANWPLVS
ncbi:MAG: glycosyltransferase family 39 protein, partial [Candidatus Binatia bacterium]